MVRVAGGGAESSGRFGQHSMTDKTEPFPGVVGGQTVRTLMFLSFDVAWGDAHGAPRCEVAWRETSLMGEIEGLILASDALSPLTACDLYTT